jgi:hypothetical protein
MRFLLLVVLWGGVVVVVDCICRGVKRGMRSEGGKKIKYKTVGTKAG